jgi:predicted acyltransferase
MNSPSQDAPGRGRVLSIDALRGFDMFWIIGGEGVALALLALLASVVGPMPEWLPYHMGHTEWIGFSAWDLIMPLFLFVVGAVMPLSFDRRIEAGQSRSRLYLKIFQRFVILFVLGMIAQGNLLEYDLAKLHLFSNTLQAIACGYVIAALAILNLRWWGQILLTIALLAGYWALMMFVPFGDHPAGTLKPDANLALYLDEMILGRFRDGTTYAWILASMTFGATVLLGVFAGRILKSSASNPVKVGGLVALGAGCLAAGWAWGLWFPIIKHLWTSSMVLWAAGWSYLLLALFYLVIDVWGFRKWAFPLVVIGANAIAVYMAAHVFDFHEIGDVFVGNLVPYLVPRFDPAAGDLLRNIAAVVVIWLILLYMYRKRTFLRV